MKEKHSEHPFSKGKYPPTPRKKRLNINIKNVAVDWSILTSAILIFTGVIMCIVKVPMAWLNTVLGFMAILFILGVLFAFSKTPYNHQNTSDDYENIGKRSHKIGNSTDFTEIVKLSSAKQDNSKADKNTPHNISSLFLYFKNRYIIL